MSSPRFETVALAGAACFVSLAWMSSAAGQEGTAQLGTTQALRSSTDLQVVILDPSESMVWQGVGSVVVTDPGGSSVGTFAAGAVIPATSVGVYTLEPTSDQSVGTPWGVTVQNSVASGGRLHSTDWNFNAGSFAASAGTNGSFYALVPGGAPGSDAVIELNLDGLAGYVYDINANPWGVAGAAGGRSVPTAGNSVQPHYPIYLQPPAAAAYGATAPSLSGLTFEGATNAADVFGAPLSCSSVGPGGVSYGAFTFTSTVAGSSHLQCDIDGDGVFSTVGSSDILLIGVAAQGTNTITWDGSDALGAPVAPGDYFCRVRVTVGEFHYVGRDIETSYEGMRMYSLDAGGVRTPLTMYWDDTDVQAGALAMANGQVGLMTSGGSGVTPGAYGTVAQPNVDARSWGANVSTGKGNQTYLDTYTWLLEDTTATLAITVADPLLDTDGDGLVDVVEECSLGTSPLLPDTDGDGTNDGVQYASVVSSSAGAGGLESHGGLRAAMAGRKIARSRGATPRAVPFVASRSSDGLDALVPGIGPGGSWPWDATPADLLTVTNATSVRGVDYLDDDGVRRGTVLLVETVGAAYEHDKALCDRAEGRYVVDVERVDLDGVPVVGMSGVGPHGGMRDQAALFRLDARDDGWSVASGWLAEDLPPVVEDGVSVAVQVWATDARARDELASAVLTRAAALGGLEVATPEPRIPARWISRAATMGGRTEFAVTGRGADAEVRATVVEQGDAWVEHWPVPEAGVSRVSRPAYRDATLELLVDGEVVDRAWISDGAWALYADVQWGAGESDLEFRADRCDSASAEGATSLWGCASVEGTVDQVGGLARWIGGGLAPLDAAPYGGVAIEVTTDAAVSLCLAGAAGAACADLDAGSGLRVLGPSDFLWGDEPIEALPTDVSIVSVARRGPGSLRMSVGGLRFLADGPKAEVEAAEETDEVACSMIARAPHAGAVTLWVGALAGRRRRASLAPRT